MSARVVVGVEVDAPSDALVWAARAASARRAVLDVVHAVGHPLLGGELACDEAIRSCAERLLRADADRVEEIAPGLEVRTVLDQDTAAHALTRRSADSELVVVGAHRLSAMERMISGSLGYQVVAGSRCPVAVIPRLPEEGARRVVVGVDGSQDGVAAVAFAAAEADRHGLELHVVHTWEQPAVFLGMEYLAGGIDERVVENERLVLAETVAGLASTYPDLVVHQHLVEGRPATVLLRAAVGAALLVVGSRGRNGVARMLLGSVSHTVVLQATVPVVVARSA